MIFCGALPPEGGGPLGSEVVRAWEIDPPKDLNQYLYRCDDHFPRRYSKRHAQG